MTEGRMSSQTRLLIAGFALFAALLFWPAGSFRWVEGWLYLGLVTANQSFAYVHLRRVNPEVIEHRLRLGKGTKRWDRV